jgi:cell division protein FtsI/penicillin-binding protein 2
LQYDRWLRGTDGYVIMQQDALRRTSSADYPRTEPIDGQNLVLTIDAEYNRLRKEELARGGPDTGRRRIGGDGGSTGRFLRWPTHRQWIE